MATTAIVSQKRTVAKEVAILGAVLVALVASAALAFGILPFGPRAATSRDRSP